MAGVVRGGWRVSRVSRVLGGRLTAVVQQLRCGIEPVWPNDCARLLVDADLAEVPHVAQRLTERPAEQERAVDVPNGAVVERDAETVADEGLYIGDSKHAQMRRQRLDGNQRLQRLSEHPVLGELVAM